MAVAGGGTGLCGFCHPDVRVEYEHSIHHSEEVGCVSCHGGNPAADSVDKAHRGDFRREIRRRDIPGLCATCHQDPQVMRPYNLPTDQYALYRTSQHGVALAKGDERVAVCTDEDALSKVYPRNTPATCASCHSDADLMSTYGLEEDPYAAFLAGRHGEALMKRQDSSSPECSRCHGAHGAAPPGVGDINKTCGQCHTTARAHFLESAHREGMSRAGLPECSSCHGHHEISTADITLLDTVCLECHDEGSAQVELGMQMKTLYTAAEADVEKARRIVARAAEIPLYIEDYTARLEEAHTSLVETLPAMHSLDLDLVDRLSGRARSIGHEVESEVRRKLDGRKWRRVGLLVFWFYLLVTVATLVHFRRRAVRATSAGSPP
jgi:hypothetical protein